MPIVYKIDVLEELKKKGYSTYRIRKENLIGQATLQTLKNGGDIDTRTLAKLCMLLQCQPGDILGYSKT